MDKEANQLYRRPQMTGQARDEEEEEENEINTSTPLIFTEPCQDSSSDSDMC